MTLTAARQVADAVLYEGYLLYPYRASSAKNQVRWQFGILGPAGAAAAGVGEEPSMSADVLVEAQDDAGVDVVLRFLQVQARVVERRDEDGGWSPVSELVVDGTRWIPFHEAVAREVSLSGLTLAQVGLSLELRVSEPGGEEIEELREGDRLVGRLVRTRWPLRGTVTVSSRPGRDPRLVVLRLHVDNRSDWMPAADGQWSARDVAARSSFVGTHLLVTAAGTRFVSLLDGPEWAAADTASCVQSRCWPVLVADDNGDDAVLVSPIILGDHPTIAPESAGDLFDATEIDEILTLRVMTMTDQEKAEARGTDPRAAAILARCDAMTDDALGRLHGARRSAKLPDADGVPGYDSDVPWWDAGQDARAQPEQDAVLVGGVPVSKGTRVLLRPSRRADAQDLFLAGMTAVVSRVYFDVDGGTHVAVVLEDDPASDLYDVTGRFYYFAPEEIEPLLAREDAR
ncbi:MAG: hypothetical protein QOJ90_2828 [Actinomycetota bacterium]|jgi:hypothetical protein|nr:hypothetical protein [Actinomycetota bacterium]